MHKSNTGTRRWGLRAVAVSAAFAGATTFTTAIASSASAVVKNINTLCAPHGGVAEKGTDWVQCDDGTVFDFDYPI